MSYYQVTQAAATVVAEDGGRSLLYLDDIFEGSGADQTHLAMLVEEGFVTEVDVVLPEPDPALDGPVAPRPGSEAAVLAEVGEDKGLAEVALAEEQAKEKPRKGLVAKLETIVAAGTGS